MNNNNGIFRRSLIWGIIILLIGAAVIPIISGSLSNDYVNAYWKFDEGSGNTAHDSSGHGYDGTIYGATWTTGYSSYALDFDGVDDYIDFDAYAKHYLGFNRTDDMIFSFYFNSQSTDFGIIYSASNDPAHGYQPGGHIALAPNGTLEFQLWFEGICGFTLYSVNTYNDGNWHYVEVRHDGIIYPLNQILKIFVDGEFDNSMEAHMCKFYADQFDVAKIGRKSYEPTDFFDGIVDEFKIIKYPGGNEQEPPTIDGPTSGNTNVEYDYTFVTNDPEGDDIWIQIDWGDGDVTDWLGSYGSGEEVIVSHEWDEEETYSIIARSKDIWHESGWSDPYEVIIGNNPPDPPTIDGPKSGNVGEELTYTFTSVDPEGDGIYYYVDWGDGNVDDWFGPFASGDKATAVHVWTLDGVYEITAKAKDENGAEGSWSDPYEVIIGNSPPNPPTIDGPTVGTPNVEYDYSFVTDDPEEDQIWLQIDWDWDDGNVEGWIGPYPSGEEVTVSHEWEEGTYNITARSKDEWHNSSWSQPYQVKIGNQPPSAPDIDGPKSGNVGEELTYTFTSIDPEGDGIRYYVNWGDGSYEDWIGPYESGEEVQVTNSWDSDGTYTVRAKANDTNGEESAWSDEITVTIEDDTPPPSEDFKVCIISGLSRGVKVKLENPSLETDVSDITYDIKVYRKLFGRELYQGGDTIDMLAGEARIIQRQTKRGIGRITVEVIVNADGFDEPIEVTRNGFIFGKFIYIPKPLI